MVHSSTRLLFTEICTAAGSVTSDLQCKPGFVSHVQRHMAHIGRLRQTPSAHVARLPATSTQTLVLFAGHCLKMSSHAAHFAEQRLQRSGRCHESELRAALGAALPRYRGAGGLPDARLRELVRAWCATLG